MTANRSMREIAETVAAAHGLTLNDLRGPSRARRVSHPRQEAMALMRCEVRVAPLRAAFSLNQIARFFRMKDHTTVIYACKAVIERDASL